MTRMIWLLTLCAGAAFVMAACSGGGDTEGLDAADIDASTSGSGDTSGGPDSADTDVSVAGEVTAPSGDAGAAVVDAGAAAVDAGSPDETTSPPADTTVEPPMDAGGGAQDAAEVPDELFSFFVTSLEAMRELSGSMDGFGGDLGGLDGADEICQIIAGTVDGGHKEWRAFLSVTSGPDGQPVHAKDRIGDGPWYDRNARLVAMNLEDLLTERPTGDPQIVEDLPNEFGQGQKQFGDNHDTLTGSNSQGMLNSADLAATCNDWTSKSEEGHYKLVMGGHSWPREDNGGGGPGGGGQQPPPAWLGACEGASEGDACAVTSGQVQFQSTCTVEDDDGTLICRPPVAPPWIKACENQPEGADCEVTKGPQKFESTCQKIEDTETIACLPEGWVPGAAGSSSQDPANWISAHTVPGCAPGVQLEQVGGGQETVTVGGGGGYGGIYCFALTP